MSTVVAEAGRMGPVPAHPAPGPPLRKDPFMLTTRPSAGRALVTGLVAAAAAAGLTACGTVDKMQSAAVVNGSRVSTEDLATATRQYNAAFPPAGGSPAASEQVVLPYLIDAKIIGPWAARTGGWKPDARFAAGLAAVPGAASSTRDLLEAATVLAAHAQGQLPAEAAAALDADLKAAKVEVSPRYGTFDATFNPAAAPTLTALTPNWLKPGSSNPAATAPAAPQQ